MLLDQLHSIEIENDVSLVKVLIADDDLPTRMLLRAAIQQWGYEVVEASNGEQAWELLTSKNPPILLVIDWLMPKMDGIELISRIKNKLSYDSYVILLTQVNGASNVIKALEAGANEFLTKPFNMSELKIRLAVGAKIMSYKHIIVMQNQLLQLCFLSMAFSGALSVSNKLLSINFDMNRLDEIYGSDKKSMNNFIKTFITSTIKLTEDAEVAIKKNDLATARNIFHNIKGSSGNSGAMVIYDLSVKAENAIISNDGVTGLVHLKKIKEILSSLQQEYISIDKSDPGSSETMSKSILIVDDNIINLKLTQIVLKNSGFLVITANDANQALSMVSESLPDLILMDMQIPEKDGLELTRIIKANPRTKHIIIVALTANAMKGDKEKALSAGCDSYITKPFDTKILPMTIFNLLNK